MRKYIGALAALMLLMTVGSLIYINVWMSVGIVIHASLVLRPLYAYRGLPFTTYLECIGQKDYEVESLVDLTFSLFFYILGNIFWAPFFLLGGYFVGLLFTTVIEYFVRLVYVNRS